MADADSDCDHQVTPPLASSEAHVAAVPSSAAQPPLCTTDQLSEKLMDSSVDELSTEPQSLDEVIDEIGFGRYQLILMVVVGIIFASEAIEVFLLTFLRDMLLKELPGSTKPLLTVATSFVFVGMLIGALGFGTIADMKGRRFAILLVIILPICAGVISCLSVNIWMFIFCQFVVGIGCGGGHIAPSLLVEILPAKDRERYVVASYSWWTVGVLFLCGAAWALREYSWRYLAAVAVSPYLICLACFKIIPESPRYDCAHGRGDHALATLQRIAKFNGTPLPHRPIFAHVVPKHTVREVLRLVMAPSLRSLTLLLWLIWAAANSSYYGMIMLSTQQILRGGEESFGAIAVESAGEIPAYILLYLLSHRFGRKLPLTVAPVISAVFMVLMKLCDTEDRSFANVKFISEVFCAFVCRCSALFMFDLVYMYTPEAYPTAVRTSGTGSCSAAARISGIATPFIAYTLLRANPWAPYILFAVLLFIAAIAAHKLPLETGGRTLEDDVAEDTEVQLDDLYGSFGEESPSVKYGTAAT